MPQLDYTTYIALISNVYISWLSITITFYMLLPDLSRHIGVLDYKRYQTFRFLYRFYGVLNHKYNSVPKIIPPKS